jgi:hypothetical protein
MHPRLGQPVFLRNLRVYPIQAENSNGLSLATVEQTLSAGQGEFRELKDPAIDEIVFINRGDEPVLMLDGEEIMGALQNRIIASSTIAEPRSDSRIPVVCAEEGRWDEIGKFKTGNYSYPSLRALLTKSRQARSDVQKKIWQEIDRKISVTKTHSATSSMHDIFDNLSDEIDRYVEDFHSLGQGTIGIIGIAGNRILGCDIFHDLKIYRKVEKKLIKSYALDALEYRIKNSDPLDIEGFFKKLAVSIGKKRTGKKTRHFRIKKDNVSGQALVYQGKTVHVSAFPSDI